MCQIPFLSQLYLCAPVCGMLNYLFWWILCTLVAVEFSAFFFKCTFMWRSKFAFFGKLFPQGSQEFWVDFETFFNFLREWRFLSLFIFEASVLLYWQLSHWMLFGSLCFLMWLLYWFAPFPFSPHNLHWNGLSLCILYWYSPNFSWLGNLFEQMLQTQSILMLEMILHNWL